MAMISSFGLCSQKNYNSLAKAIKNNQAEEAEHFIMAMNRELENTAEKLENNRCSGEVFIALFVYFETTFGICVRGDEVQKELAKNWRETTGDNDMIALFEKDKIAFSALQGSIDYDAVNEFVSLFFQNDYGDSGKIACDVFLSNIQKVDSDQVLILHG